VESEDELYTINEIAIDMNTKANISVRVNPAISVDTHPYITTGMKDNKFGIEQSQILPMYIKASKLAGINIMGIDFHIGSQIMDINPYIESLNKILEIIDQLDSHGIMLKHIDIGGGLGISYRNESAVSKDTFVTEIIHAIGERNLSIIAEPGRSIVGESGLLVSKVTNIKKTPFKNFAVVDAGMNDLLRPPLYEAYHSIKEVLQKSDAKLLYDVVGPICETADFLGKSRNLTIEKGDFLVVENVGAYGYSLSSNYNTRPKIDEYIISNSNINKIRDRETIEQILENELKYL
jgi:diaminopimelate decarboxylase